MLRSRRARLVLSVLVPLALLGPAPPALAAGSRGAAAVEQRVVDLVNAARAAHGVPPLRVDVRLVAGARAWSRRLAAEGGLRHERDRAMPPGTRAHAENVALTGAGGDVAAALHGDIERSPRHRAILLDPRYTDLGVGVAIAGGRTYLTQRFTAGAPAAVDPAVRGLADLAGQVWGEGGARHAVIARDDVFPDALAAGPLAGRDGPILLTPPGPALHPAAAAALHRVLPRGGTVWLVGGTAAVSEGVERELAADGYAVRRIAGSTRVGTAAAVAAVVGARGPVRTAVVATAWDWPDAVAGGAFGAARGAPVLLTDPHGVPEPTRRALAALAPAEVVVLGGAGAVHDGTAAALGARRVAGRTRAGTAAAIAADLWGYADVPPPRWLAAPADATGWTWAVGAAPVAARLSAPVLLTGPVLDPELAAYLARLRRDRPADLLTLGPVPDAGAGALRALLR